MPIYQVMYAMTLQRFDIVSSTMDVARDNLISGRLRYNQAGRLPYQGVIAQEQTAGRGQRGRGWYAPYGESLCATYYFRRGLMTPQNAGRLSLLAGVSVADTLQRASLQTAGMPSHRLHTKDGREEGIEQKGRRGEGEKGSKPKSKIENRKSKIGLKWPNDVLFNGKKVGGILVELVRTPTAGWVALIGVGVNVKVQSFPPDLAGRATSLYLEGVQIPSLSWLGESIADALDALADRLITAGFEAILRRWRCYDQTSGTYYQTELEGAVVTGIAEGIDETGALLLRLDDSSLCPVLSASSLQEIRVET